MARPEPHRRDAQLCPALLLVMLMFRLISKPSRGWFWWQVLQTFRKGLPGARAPPGMEVAPWCKGMKPKRRQSLAKSISWFLPYIWPYWAPPQCSVPWPITNAVCTRLGSDCCGAQYSPAGHRHATSKATSGQLQGQITIFPWAQPALDGPEQSHLGPTPPPMGPGGYLSSAGGAHPSLKASAGPLLCFWPCSAGLLQAAPAPGGSLGWVLAPRASPGFGMTFRVGCWICVAALSLSPSPLVPASLSLDSGCLWGCQQTLPL